jgi:hypothetical protein
MDARAGRLYLELPPELLPPSWFLPAHSRFELPLRRTDVVRDPSFEAQQSCAVWGLPATGTG